MASDSVIAIIRKQTIFYYTVSLSMKTYFFLIEKKKLMLFDTLPEEEGKSEHRGPFCHD